MMTPKRPTVKTWNKIIVRKSQQPVNDTELLSRLQKTDSMFYKEDGMNSVELLIFFMVNPQKKCVIQLYSMRFFRKKYAASFFAALYHYRSE